GTEGDHTHGYNIDAAFEVFSQGGGPRGTPRGAIVRCCPEGKSTSQQQSTWPSKNLPPAPRYLNQPTASSTEVELPAAHPFTPAEDERDAHIRILVTALQYVLDYLPQDYAARELHTVAAHPPTSVLRRA
ncbi:hypothetical protein MRX96_050587, partial [Rhipicephalus microplus]